jgi:hypothetical protein
MNQSGILYDSLPMMRLGAKVDTEEVFIAPDFSISAYMLEEYMALAVGRILIPKSAPESRRLADFPELLRKRVRVVDDTSDRDAVNRMLYPVRKELQIGERNDGQDLHFPKAMPHDIRHMVRLIHKSSVHLAIGFNQNLQIGVIPDTVRTAVRALRMHLRDANGRVVLAQLEGFFAVYEEVAFESPHPPSAAPVELVSLFDRLLNDRDYLCLSEAVAEIAEPQKRAAALSRTREWGRRLMSNPVVTKGWNFTGKAVKAWTGAPLPEADALSTIVSGKQFPVLVDLRDARKRAVASWRATLNSRPPLSASGNEYEGMEWIMPGAPPEDWDGGDVSTFHLGTAGDLKKALERFAQQPH